MSTFNIQFWPFVIESFSYLCSMKWLIAILFFNLLALSWIPCFCSEENEGRGDVQQLSVNNNHGNHQSDGCNPFCSCSCCATSGFYYYKETYSVKAVTPFNQQKFPQPQQFFYFHNCHNIWQPPRMS